MQDKWHYPEWAWFPGDGANPPDPATVQGIKEDWLHHYYGYVKEFKIKSVFEIGVRAGYSAFAMFSANPRIFYRGVDINMGVHGGFSGSVYFALGLLKYHFPDASIQIRIADSQQIKFLDTLAPSKTGRFDLAHIDGDHSYAGALHDLELCLPYSKIMVVDDYDFDLEVRQAVDDFLRLNRELRSEYRKNFRGHMLIFRDDYQAQKEG